MIGELLQGVFKEAIGDDPQNQRVAGLPYSLSTVYAGSVNALGRNDVRQEAPGPLGP
jgi:hypothetical protein